VTTTAIPMPIPTAPKAAHTAAKTIKPVTITRTPICRLNGEDTNRRRSERAAREWDTTDQCRFRPAERVGLVERNACPLCNS
jgi:hypothetical protein